MALQTILPRPPYSLATSARGKSDATRRFVDGVLTLVLDAGDGPAVARIRQRPDASLSIRIDGTAGEATLERLRFVLAVDDDHGYGLGRRERGLVGDLRLVKLCAALHGRWADADDTRAVLAPYGEWAGFASVYLLAGAKWLSVPRSASRLGVRTRDEVGGRRSHDAIAAVL